MTHASTRLPTKLCLKTSTLQERRRQLVSFRSTDSKAINCAEQNSSTPVVLYMTELVFDKELKAILVNKTVSSPRRSVESNDILCILKKHSTSTVRY